MNKNHRRTGGDFFGKNLLESVMLSQKEKCVSAMIQP